MCFYITLALCISLLIPAFPVSVIAAQESKQPPPAPVPSQIHSAKRIFIGNAGGDDLPWGSLQFRGGPDRAYNAFYAAMKNWGRFELADSPSSADLLLEIRFTVPPVGRSVLRGESVGPAEYDPQFRLLIRDPKSQALLWGLTEHVQWAMLQGDRDKNFDEAISRIVRRVHGLATPSAATGDAPKQK